MVAWANCGSYAARMALTGSVCAWNCLTPHFAKVEQIAAVGGGGTMSDLFHRMMGLTDEDDANMIDRG